MKRVWSILVCVVVTLGCGGAPSAGPAETSPPRATTNAEARPQRSATPSPQEVVQAMNAVTPAVAACGGGAHGQVGVRIVFDSSGAVMSASINPTYHYESAEPGPDCEPTPDSRGYYRCARTRPPEPELDACFIRAVESARLPPFGQATFSVNYPFRY